MRYISILFELFQLSEISKAFLFKVKYKKWQDTDVVHSECT